MHQQLHFSPSLRGFYSPEVHATMPADCVEVTHEQHSALMAGQAEGKLIEPGPDGWPVLAEPPALTREQRVTALANIVLGHVNSVARAMGYDNIAAAVSYADEPAVPRYQVQGRALRTWRSLVWASFEQQTAAGDQLPTAAELIAALPKAERA